MGFEYALVHLVYTIPPALLLSCIYRPLLTSIDIYKITFLIIIAVVATIPWDSYLIRNRVWSYPPDVIAGLTLWAIPAEELFFFAIQTYNTSLFYLLLSKPTFHPAYLRGQKHGKSVALWGLLGTTLFGVATAWGWILVNRRQESFYLGLIVAWAGTFMTLLWALAHQLLLTLPYSNTILPILLPTGYLWVVDTISLRRGTWVIEKGTKLGIEVWQGLEVEEALFFLVTNCMIVFGLVAFDNALAILNAFPRRYPHVPVLPSPYLLIQALLLPRQSYDELRLEGFADALARLRSKSRSFYLASGAFTGRLRIDLLLLYSFCRVADDLIDEARSREEARHWIRKLNGYLNAAFSTEVPDGLKNSIHLKELIDNSFPSEVHYALQLLPTRYLDPKPFYDLLKGFEMDLQFSSIKSTSQRSIVKHDDSWPIADQELLHLYGELVAGTVAELCIGLSYHHASGHRCSNEEQTKVLRAGRDMGVALQLVNIARDICVDASMHRLYIPLDWINDEGISAENVLEAATLVGQGQTNKKVERLRRRLLDDAFKLYAESRRWIEKLPLQSRAPMRVAVESYMEIGRVMREAYKGNQGIFTKRGRATVPKLRRITVAWKALLSQ